MNRLLTALHAILDALPAGPWVVVGDYYEHHAGDVYNEAPDDEGCDCDPDTGQSTYVLMAVPDAADLFAEVGRRCKNGGDPEDEGWTMARTLELGGDVA